MQSNILSFVLFKCNCSIVSCSDNVIEEIQNKLQNIRNPMAAMMVLLRELDLETEADLGEAPITPGRKKRTL